MIVAAEDGYFFASPASTLALVPIQPPVQWALSQEVQRPRPRLPMRETIPPNLPFAFVARYFLNNTVCTFR